MGRVYINTRGRISIKYSQANFDIIFVLHLMTSHIRL